MADLTLHYAPRTRSFTALWLLEELGQPYELESFDINTGRHKRPDFLALNPMGKVPVVIHAGTPVSELGAIAIYRLLQQKDGFTPLDHELFNMLGGHAATALFAAKLYSQSERKLNTIQGFIDLLTN